MFRTLISRVREWIAVEDAEERIEGSGDAIVSPQHRRTADAERELERLEDVADEAERENP